MNLDPTGLPESYTGSRRRGHVRLSSKDERKVWTGDTRHLDGVRERIGSRSESQLFESPRCVRRGSSEEGRWEWGVSGRNEINSFVTKRGSQRSRGE